MSFNLSSLLAAQFSLMRAFSRSSEIVLAERMLSISSQVLYVEIFLVYISNFSVSSIRRWASWPTVARMTSFETIWDVLAGFLIRV